jgi:hypothetical protein
MVNVNQSTDTISMPSWRHESMNTTKRLWSNKHFHFRHTSVATVVPSIALGWLFCDVYESIVSPPCPGIRQAFHNLNQIRCLSTSEHQTMLACVQSSTVPPSNRILRQRYASMLSQVHAMLLLVMIYHGVKNQIKRNGYLSRR